MGKERNFQANIVIEEKDLAPLIRIDDADLVMPAPTVLQVSWADLARLDEQVLRIEEHDLPQVVKVTMADLPPIIQIGLADLPADLTNATTECYHGTSWDAAERIRQEGFRVGSGTGLGAGIYFSVGAITVAQGYAKSARPCIIRARVDWGKVAYLDDPKLPAGLKGSGNGPTEHALKLGYHSFLTSSKYSVKQPAIGIVLARIGSYVKPPRIEVVDLLDPRRPNR